MDFPLKLRYPNTTLKEKPMDIQIVTVFYLCDKLLEALNHQQDPQTQISDAEVMTTAIVAALFCGGNFTTACDFLKTHRYIPNMLSKRRFIVKSIITDKLL